MSRGGQEEAETLPPQPSAASADWMRVVFIHGADTDKKVSRLLFQLVARRPKMLLRLTSSLIPFHRSFCYCWEFFNIMQKNQSDSSGLRPVNRGLSLCNDL